MDNFVDCHSCKYFKETQIDNSSILYSCDKKSKKDLPINGNILEQVLKEHRDCYVDKNKSQERRTKKVWKRHYQQKSLKKS